MDLPAIETIKINEVIHQLEAYEAVGSMLFERLNQIVSSEERPKLLILDFSELNLLTYGFVEIALEGLVDYTRKNNDLIVLYRIKNPELEELITGLIDLLELQALNVESMDERNLLAKHYFISYFVSETEIEHLGEINDVELAILKIIEIKGETSHNEIDNQLKLDGRDHYCEDIAKSVEKLFHLGFIHQIEKNTEIPSRYFSLLKIYGHDN